MAGQNTSGLIDTGSDLYHNDTEDLTDNTTSGPNIDNLGYINAVYAAASRMPLFQAGYALLLFNAYGLPPLALLCNFLTIATMTRLKPFTSSSLFICSLAVSDTLVLFLKMFDTMVDTLEIPITDYGCGVLYFVANTILHVSVWTIVVMTSERFVAVIFPLHVNSLFTMKKTKLSIFLLYVIFALVDAHHVYTIGIRYVPSKFIGYYCGYRPGITMWYRNIWFWINTALFAIIPCSALLIMNVAIVLGIKASHKKQKQMVAENTGKKDSQQRHITIMLLSISFAYIVFFTPVCVYMIASIGFEVFKSPEIFAWFSFVTNLVFIISSLNHVVNFIFYFASNSRFRTALTQFLKCQDVSGKAKSMTVSNVNTLSSGVSTQPSTSMMSTRT